MKAFATLIDDTEQELQDTSNAIWTAAELGIQMEDAIREISEYKPYLMKYVYTIESRTGTASGTTSDALVDATETQFLSTDVGKVIYNTYDNTWAIVTAYVSSSQLTLSKDIMTSGEQYEIYNKGCDSKRQINIEDITDYVGPANHGVVAVEYPIGKRRNFKIEGDILTIDVAYVPDSKVTTPAANTEVNVWVEARQRVSQLTDLVGAIDNGAGYAAGSTSIVLKDLSGTEIVGEDTLFTIASVRGTYRVTAAVTLSSGGGTVVVHPALIDAAADADVVTVTGSTLNSELERLLVELTVARAAMSKSLSYINILNVGGSSVHEKYQTWGERKLSIVLAKLERLKNRRAPRTKRSYPR